MLERAEQNSQWARITRRAGVPEVETDWVADHFDEVRVIDVREKHELAGQLGYIDGVEHVPLGRLGVELKDWDRDDKLVILCRSGGRSGRAARALEQSGFRYVASMAGGMLKWNDEDRPTAR